MKTNAFLVRVALAAFALSVSSMAFAESRIPATSSEVGLLGDGYSSRDQRVLSKCAVFDASDIEWRGLNQSTFDFSLTASQDEVEKDFGIDVGGKYRTGVTETNASAKFARNSKTSGFSISYVWVSQYDFAPIQLSKVDFDPGVRANLKPETPDWVKLNPNSPDYERDLWAKSNIRIINPDRFFQSCGNEVVYKQEVHAKLYINLRIDFATEAEATDFSTHVDFSSPTFAASASVHDLQKHVSSNTKFTISALQVGGDISALTNVFGKDDANQGFAVVQCTFGNIGQCQQVMQKAIAYASNSFANQINAKDPNILANIGTPRGPAMTMSYSRDWREANLRLLSDLSPQAKELNEEAKRQLRESFETVFGQWHRLVRIKEVKLPRLSLAQEQGRAKDEAISYTSLKLLKDAIQSCYDRPLDCQSAYDQVKQNTITIFRPEDFVFEAQSIAQFCDAVQVNAQYVKGQLDPVAPTPQLIKTVEALKRIAIHRDATVATSADLCGAVDTALSDIQEIDLSKKNLEGFGLKDDVILDLAPLRALPKLTKLDLSGIGFGSRDLRSLSQLNQLSELTLDDNKIDSVDFLAPLVNLQTLRLNQNPLGDTSSLNSLTQLKTLELRNTGEDRICPFADRPNVCDLVDYADRGEFLHLRDYGPSRHIGHQAIRLSDGLIGIFGGQSGSSNEIFNPNTNRISDMPQSKTERSWFTATAYGGSPGPVKVLIFGGALAGPPALIFDPGSQPQTRAVATPDSASRIFARSELLPSGRILIFGGFPTDSSNLNGSIATLTSFVFDPATETLSQGPSLLEARAQHQSVILDDGRLLTTGGVDRNGSDGSESDRVLNSAEAFDGKQFTRLTARMKVGRFLHQMTKLRDGRILITGGFTKSESGVLQDPTETAEIFDPKINRFEILNAKMSEPRAVHQAVLLKNGQVLILGGAKKYSSAWSINGSCNDCLNSAELFDPVHMKFVKLGAAMIAPRAFFTATPIDDGRILIVGGLGSASSSAEIFGYDF